LRADKYQIRELVTKWELAGFFAIVAIVLVMLFPEKQIKQILEEGESSPYISTIYLEDIVRKNPSDIEALMQLLNLYRVTSQFEKADGLMRSVPEHLTYLEREELYMTQYLITKSKVLSFEKGAPERIEGMKQLIQSLRDFLFAYSSVRMLDFVYTEALSIDTSEIALKASKKLIRFDPDRSLFWMVRSAKLSIALGRYREAYGYYLMAYRTAADPQQKRVYLRRMFDALRSGGLVKEAAKKAYAYYESADLEMKRYFLKIAREAGDDRLAYLISLDILETSR
jgi:tetratricopeptide (TPR) repeat protein